MPAMRVVDASSSTRPSPVRSIADATIHAIGASICDVVTDNTAVVANYSRMTKDASLVPTASYPPTDGVIVTSGVCPDGTVAILAPPPLDPGMASAGDYSVAQRATFFFGASARGVMCQQAL
jgi:hypothetical protein